MKRKINPAVVLAPTFLIFVILHPIFNDRLDCKKYKPVYNYVENLPKNIMIAGYPKSLALETIPLFSRRAIFFADGMRDEWLFVYGAKDLQKRREDLIEAIYADSLDKVEGFISKYNIDYFIVESYVYENSFLDLLKNSISPYDQQTYSLLKTRKPKNSFILLQLARQFCDFKSKENGYDIFVLSSKKIRKSE